MREPRTTEASRGQAFTLEGIVGTVIILTALLFALESVIITPTTGGTVDPEVRDRLSTQSSDILSTTGQNTSFGLNEYIRYFDTDEQTFYDGVNRDVGYGRQGVPRQFGALLDQTFDARGRLYNIELQYLEPGGGTGTVTMVDQGRPSDNAVTTTYTVTLYDNQTLTAPNAPPAELVDYSTNPDDPDNPYYPIPDAAPDEPIYNVVEVRLTVW